MANVVFSVFGVNMATSFFYFFISSLFWTDSNSAGWVTVCNNPSATIFKGSSFGPDLSWINSNKKIRWTKAESFSSLLVLPSSRHRCPNTSVEIVRLRCNIRFSPYSVKTPGFL